MKRYKTCRLAMVTGLALALGAPLLQAADMDTAAQRGQLSASDYRFAADAARGGMEEVELGQLAQQKGVNQSVRDFGQRMVTDHNQANNELKQLLASKGATLPTELSHHERSTINDLQNASGADFDKTYARDMVKDHKRDVKDFQKAAKDVNDPELKAWAQKTSPTLEEHSRMAQDMENTVKGEK